MSCAKSSGNTAAFAVKYKRASGPSATKVCARTSVVPELTPKVCESSSTKPALKRSRGRYTSTLRWRPYTSRRENTLVRGCLYKLTTALHTLASHSILASISSVRGRESRISRNFSARKPSGRTPAIAITRNTRLRATGSRTAELEVTARVNRPTKQCSPRMVALASVSRTPIKSSR